MNTASRGIYVAIRRLVVPRIQLTDISVRSLKPPERGQTTYWDTSLKGFGCRTSQGGTRSFVLMYGANRKLTTIGRYPNISLSEARKEAKRILAQHTLGKHRPITISFEAAQERFLEDCKAKNRPRTVSDYERLLTRHFRLGKVHLEDVTQHELMRRINKLIPASIEGDSFRGFPIGKKSESMRRTGWEVRHGQSDCVTGRF